jgi:zinc protease
MTPQAMAIAGFLGADGPMVADNRALKLASNVLSSRLVKRIREDLSIVYSIRAGHQPSWIYEDSGMFMASAPCDPENASKVVEEVHDQFKKFADEGPTAEELENAKKQVANDLDTDLREPRFWTGVLQDLDLHGRKLNDLKNINESYQQITAEQIQSTFKRYYKPERQLSVTAVPTTPSEEDKKPAGAPS